MVRCRFVRRNLVDVGFGLVAVTRAVTAVSDYVIKFISRIEFLFMATRALQAKTMRA